MTVYKTIITPYAKNQIETTVQYINIKLENKTAARKWAIKIKESIDRLKYFPFSHSLVSEEPWKQEGIRILIVDGFNIYYYINDKNRIVYILSVIYGKRDQLKQLKEMSGIEKNN